MLGFKGPAQPSPTLGDAINAGYLYLEVRCLGCDAHQTVALDIVRRPKTTPVHELERYMRCRQCSEVRGCPYKRSHLVAVRPPRSASSALDVVAGRAVRRGKSLIKYTTDSPYSDPDKAARRLLEHAQAFEPTQDGRIYIEKLNGPFLFGDKGTPAEYAAGLDRAIAWLA